jgi:ABC-type multidrug transport system ATPase subunit
VCDRVAILYKGRIVAMGKVDELMNSKEQDLEAVFLRITEEEEDAANRQGGAA